MLASDLPSFVSDRYLVYFDPSAKYLPDVNPGNPGKLKIWFLKTKLIENYPNQFKPFHIFDCNLSKKFHGTLFRLPLRTKQQVKPKNINLSKTHERIFKLKHIKKLE